MVDVDPEEVLDGPDLERRAAERVGGVDPLVALPGDRGERVARDRDLVERAAAGMDDHQRVRARGQAVGRRRIAVGGGLEALRLRLGAGLVAPLRARVGPDHEDVLAVGDEQREAAELGGRLRR